MADLVGMREDDALTFMVSAGLVYEIIAAACSSPQTTEINAGARSETLMKWVYIGIGQAALFVLIAAYMSKRPFAAISGGALAAILLLGQYVHARNAGLSSDAPGTEEY
ncbi:MAG TPA: hypothetical protein VGE93_06495 [Bryobacteraceae bacterium]